MRSLSRVAAVLQLLLLLCGLGFGQTPISVPTSATTPATLPDGSYKKITLVPGPNTLTIDINGTYTGQFAVQCAFQGSAGPLRTWPTGSIINSLKPGATGIEANAEGTWTCTVPGPGAAYLVATSLSSGSPTAILSAGSGDSGGAVASVGYISNPAASFNRPANTTPYTIGDLVANSATYSSVTPITIQAARYPGGSFAIQRLQLKKSGPSLTNAQFRVHLFETSPTIDASSGDNLAFLCSQAGHLGSFDVTCDKAWSDGADGYGTPNVGSALARKLASGQNIYALIEARAAYTPVSGETFTITPEVVQNSLLASFQAALCSQASTSDLHNYSAVAGGYFPHSAYTCAQAKSGATNQITCSSYHQFNGVGWEFGGNWVRWFFPSCYPDAANSIGEQPLPNQWTLRSASWQGLSDTTTRPIYFNGSRSVRMPAYGGVWCDPVWISYGDGYWGNFLTCLETDSPTDKIPGCYTGLSDPNRENAGRREGICAGNVVDQGYTAVGSSSGTDGSIYGPQCAVGYYPPGKTPPQSIGMQADSHGESNDPSANGRPGTAFIERLCLDQLAPAWDATKGQVAPCLKWIKGGEDGGAAGFLGHNYVRTLTRYFVTDIFIEVSNHDAEASDVLAPWEQVEKDLVWWASQGWRVKHIWIVPPYPKTTGDVTSPGTQVAASVVSRPGMLSWLGDATTTGAISANQKTYPTVNVLNVLSSWESDAGGTLTEGGGRFSVVAGSSDYTLSVKNTTSLQTYQCRADITFTGGDTLLSLKGARGIFTSGTQAGTPFNIEFLKKNNDDGSYTFRFSPSLNGAPAQSDTFIVYKGLKGPITDRGTHLLGNGACLAAQRLKSLGILAKTSVTPMTPSVPTVPFDPYTYTSYYLFDPAVTTTLYKDQAVTIPVTAYGDVTKTMQGLNSSGAIRTVTDSVGGTYALGSIGQPCITFNGSTQRLRKAATSVISQPMWIMFVYRQTTAQASAVIVTGNNGTTHRIQISNTASGVGNLLLNAGTASNIGANADMNLKRVLIYVNGASSKCWINEVQVTISTGNPGSQDLDGLTLFANQNASIGNAAAGELYFAAYLTDALSDNEALGARQYMAGRWPDLAAINQRPIVNNYAFAH